MRIGFDISALPYGTGVSRYTANVASQLATQMNQDQLVVFGSSFRQKKMLASWCQALPPPITRCLYPFPPSVTSVLFNSLHLDIARLIGPVDIFHTWDWYVPALSHGVLISTVHDLSTILFPEGTEPHIRAHHHHTLKYLKTHAPLLITVSQATKQDLINTLQFDPQQLVVIPEALPQESALPSTPDQIERIKRHLGITKPYFLMVGTLEKRKNYLRQISAWQHFKADYQLVIVGKPGNERLQPQPGIILCPPVDQAGLAALYEGSTLFLYASLYEGFGLPVLEAFFHATPVVTSNLSSLPEVAGQAAVLVDPNHPESIIIGIGQALQNRVRFVSLGRERLLAFSWDSVAQQTLLTYQQAVQIGRPTSH